MSNRVPKLRHHKGTGQFCVVLGGQYYYLGKNHDEAQRRYDAMIQEWLANDRCAPAPPVPEMSITELCVRYFKMAQGYYSAAEILAIRAALRTVRRLYGPEPVTAFGPKKLKAVRQVWVDDGNSRRYVNRKTSIVKRMFRWAVSEEIIPSPVLHSLESVRGLGRGRSEARELPPVQPVDWKTVEATLPHLPDPVAAMVQIQAFSGMRPGEVLRMRMREINRDGKVWLYTPASHKTQHLGHTRTVFLGPKAQAILRDFFKADPDAHLFTRGATGKPYSVVTYRCAVTRGCEAAGIAAWLPRQLRHNKATEIRRAYGLEAAQTALGHVKMDTTEIYAEKNIALAMRVAEETG